MVIRIVIMNNHGILVVDDDSAFRSGVERFLRQRGCANVRSACDGPGALDMVKEETPDVVLLDLCMPQMSGIKTLHEILKISDQIAVFILTCEEDEEFRNLAAKQGAAGYLTKPIAMEQLYATINPCLKH